MSFVRCGLLPQAEQRLEERSAALREYSAICTALRTDGSQRSRDLVSGPDGATLQAGIAAHEQVLDESIVRAITPDDTAESILELLRACAPM